MVGQHNGDHRLGHRDKTRQQAGIVTALGADGRRFATSGNRGLFLRQAAGRFHRGTQHDRHAARNAPEHAAVTIGPGRDAGARLRRIRGVKEIVVLATSQRRRSEPNAVLHAQHRRQTEECLGQVSLELVEHRLAEPGRYPGRDNLGHPADRVALLADLLDQSHHLRRAVRVRATNDVRRPGRQGLDLVQCHGRRVWHVRHNVPDLTDVADDGTTKCRRDDLLGHDTGRNTHAGFTSTRPATTAIVARTVLRVVGVVGVPGPIFVLDIRVVATALIRIPNQNGDRSARCLSLEDAGEDLRCVRLVAWGHDVALPRAPTGQVLGQIGRCEHHTGRTALDDHDIPRPVRLAGGTDAKGMSERVARHTEILHAPGRPTSASAC